ncbi:hypothetical protein WR25_06165 [Diploscapter pachys]|uniref:SLC12A transporter C-terminal domain-containing protein n=1 Tax=Diploscapter pachys TaxID=2018661 RepID=A0A2A2LTD8_9BILA|nr:hypothetical protein WR25_06165 [Diploscapter pachys]
MCELSWSAALSFLYICCMILMIAFFATCSSELALYAMVNIFESSSGILAHVLAALLCLVLIAPIRLPFGLRIFVFLVSIVCLIAYLVSLFLALRIPVLLYTNFSFTSPNLLLCLYFPAAVCPFTVISVSSRSKYSIALPLSLLIPLGAYIFGLVALEISTEFVSNNPNKTLHEGAFNPLYGIPVAVSLFIPSAFGAAMFHHFAVNNLQIFFSTVFPKIAPTGTITYRLIVSCGAAFACLFGGYDVIAIPLTVFCLVTYALFHYSFFRSALRDNTVHTSLPFCSCILTLLSICLAFAASWVFAIAAAIIFTMVYLFLKWSDNDVLSPDAVHGHGSTYTAALANLQALNSSNSPYRPNILLLTGNPASRPALVDFAHAVTNGHTALYVAYILERKVGTENPLIREKIERRIGEWLESREVKAFPIVMESETRVSGSISLLQTVGISAMRPNIVMLGMHTNFGRKNFAAMNAFFQILVNEDTGFDMSSAMGDYAIDDEHIVDFVKSIDVQSRDSRGSDRQHARGKHGSIFSVFSQSVRKLSHMTGVASRVSRDSPSIEEQPENGISPTMQKKNMHNAHTHVVEDKKNKRFEVVGKHNILNQGDMVVQLQKYRNWIPGGTIDIWWLQENGGLMLLLPHMLTLPGSFLEDSKLRVFTKATPITAKINDEHKAMAALLRKFSIDSSDVHMIEGFDDPPEQETIRQFKRMMYIVSSESGERGSTNEDELHANIDTTKRLAKVSELIREHSKDANLVVINMPTPQRHGVSAALFLGWLHLLTRDLPPTLLIKGNTNVSSY